MKISKKFIIMALIFILPFNSMICANASDDFVVGLNEEYKYLGSMFDLADSNQPIRLFSNKIENSLDFSRLNDVLTIEVSGDTENSVLYTAKYDSSDRLTSVDVNYDVDNENTVSVTDSAYERVFLWDRYSQEPLCKSISTKCSYEIVEGVSGEWETSEDGHTLYRYLGSSENVTIPNSYNGKRIYFVENTPAIKKGDVKLLSEISKYCIFGENNHISSVNISEGIQILGNYVFAGCTRLDCEFDLPDTVNTIGGYVYYNCSAMHGSIDFSKLDRIYGYAFMSCASLTGSLNLSHLTVLKDYAFYGCSGLNGTLTLPTVKTIPKAAFYNCNNLCGSLIIPEGVETISDYAFSVTGGKFSALVLPSTLKVIGFAAFQLQNSFSNELILPEGLEYIGDVAFNHCTKFSNKVFYIPSTVKVIGGDLGVETNTGYGCHVFYDSFKNVISFIADSDYFTSIDGVLYNSDITRLVAYPPAKSDESFTVPEGIVQIDEMAFGYSKIKSLTLPDSYTISEEVPDNVLNDMANTLAVAFYHNNAIENIYFSPNNTKYTSINGLVYSKNLEDLWYVPTNKTGVINIENGTKNIKKGAFYIEYASGGEKYTGVNIPASVIYINNENIKSINLRPLSSIKVDEDNLYYSVSKGNLIKIQ